MKNVAEQIERAKEGYERKGMVSTSVTPEQLERKLKRANGPMIVSQGWSGSAPVGGTIDYNVGISNPDPVDYIWLFVHLFIGPANIAPDVDDAVVAVNGRSRAKPILNSQASCSRPTRSKRSTSRFQFLR